MKIFVPILILCYLIHVESVVSCSGWIYIPKFKRCIRHFCNRVKWKEAKESCERNNSRLVIPCNREYSDMVATLASLYEINRANSWIGFKSTRSGWESKEISDYKAIESGHCTGSALNWYKPEQEHVTECLQNYAGESDAFQLMIDTSECDLVHWFVCEKEGGCDTV